MILIKITAIYRFSSKIKENLVCFRKISILIHILDYFDIGQILENLDFRQNLQKCRFLFFLNWKLQHMVIILFNSRFWSQIFQNPYFGQNFFKISIFITTIVDYVKI